MGQRAAPSSDRSRRLARRAVPAAVLAAAAFAGGLVAGAVHVSPEQRLVQRFADAWRRRDFAAMRAQLTDARRRAVDAATLARAYAIARSTSTTRSFAIGRPRGGDDRTWLLPVVAHTAIFGDVRGTVRLPVEGSGDAARIDWDASMTFPGVAPGERLERHTRLPERAALLARDNRVLAEGEARTSPELAGIAASIVGQLGPIPPDQADAYRRAGYPDDARVGVSGLERIFERRLAGKPGGELLAGDRVLASSRPRKAPPVRTTISPSVQEAAVAALAGRLGGTVVMAPRSGEILGAAGIAFSGLQPPGSTFKMVTVSAALADGVARPTTTFPYATSATLAGVELGNANGESCGGTLVEAFAVSCNSVFAPLGAKLGPRRLVAMAERFGFNHPPSIPGAATSTIPPPEEIGDDLAAGATAIGQGRVLATALQMMSVAATIGLDGRRPIPTLAYTRGSPTHLGPRVLRPRIAREVQRMMVAVVREGTGTAAALPGVTVAGKTGTAELRTTQPCTATDEDPESCAGDTSAEDTTDTDAWFAAFAPARDPQVAVGVMLVSAGAGGDTAAPAARQLLAAALD